MPKELTDKQKKFAEIYLKELNATKAATEAGYSAKTAYSIGQRLLKNIEIRKYLDQSLEEQKSERIASATEVLEGLTKIFRGETSEEVVVVESKGDFCSKARVVNKKVSVKERVRAGELLAKGYGLLIDRKEVSGGAVVQIVNDVVE